MNKVEKVSIGKCAFSLDEKAYATIKDYLDSLNLYYSKMDSGKEILEGIEERMAELLLEKTGNGVNVVSSDVADEVIEILGRPEVIEEGTPESSGPKYNPEGKKRLYRDPSNKILGGVCSGLAAYFNTDAVLIRVLFVALTLLPGLVTAGHGSSIVPLIYLIGWIAMPKADTLRKQCEMRGQSLGIADIENQYKDGSAFVKDNNSDFWRVVGRVFAIFVGLILVSMGVTGLLVGGFAAFGSTALFHIDSQFIMNTLQEIFEEFGSSYYSFNAGITPLIRVLLIVFASLVYFLPAIGCIYAGIHLIFNLKSPSWRPGLVLFILWLLSIVALFVMLIIAASSVAAFKSTITAFIPFLF